MSKRLVKQISRAALMGFTLAAIGASQAGAATSSTKDDAALDLQQQLQQQQQQQSLLRFQLSAYQAGAANNALSTNAMTSVSGLSPASSSQSVTGAQASGVSASNPLINRLIGLFWFQRPTVTSNFVNTALWLPAPQFAPLWVQPVIRSTLLYTAEVINQDRSCLNDTCQSAPAPKPSNN